MIFLRGQKVVYDRVYGGRQFVKRPQEVRTFWEGSNISPLFYIVLMIIGTVMLIAFVILQINIAHINYAVENSQQEIAYLERENQVLRLRIAAGTNLRRIEERAFNELGMIRPVNQEFVLLPSSIEDSDIMHSANYRSGVWEVVEGFSQWFKDRITVAARALSD